MCKKITKMSKDNFYSKRFMILKITSKYSLRGNNKVDYIMYNK